MNLGHGRIAVAGLALAGALCGGSAIAADSGAGTGAQSAAARIQGILGSLHPIRGDVPLSKADATLRLGQRYYFLDAADSKKVLTEGWGNPDESADGVLGMVFPVGKTFADADTWGAVITYINDGYVPDKEARTTNYDQLLTQMRKGEDEENGERKKHNFDPVHLVGWAQSPSYDAGHHSLIWAKDLQFGGQKVDSLNYDVRELGRRGVLSLNIVSDMSHLAEVRTAATDLGAVADFNPGARYADYQEGVDKRAAYGVAGLIAAGAGVALAQKAGLLAVLVLVLKKAGIFIVAAIAAGWTRLKGMFRRKSA